MSLGIDVTSFDSGLDLKVLSVKLKDCFNSKRSDTRCLYCHIEFLCWTLTCEKESHQLFSKLPKRPYICSRKCFNALLAQKSIDEGTDGQSV